MLIEHPRATEHWPVLKGLVHKGLWIGGAVFLGLIVTAILALATHWPFTRDAVTRALEEASGRTVRIRTFTNLYFPPGCTAGGITFLRHIHPEGPPIINVEKLVIQGSLTGMFTSPKRLSAVRIFGMRMQIPPKTPGEATASVPLNSGPGGQSLAISKITADGALLEFLPAERDAKPYRLKIDRLAITDVGSGKPMSYRATLTNTEPPGVIRSEGRFGPWNPQDIGATLVSGAYAYDDIDLAAFHSISGLGHARGKFYGPLARIQTQGSIAVSAFHVDGGDHSVNLDATYDATVNGTNGDVLLDPASARFRNTQVEVRGWIAGHSGEPGKTAAFDVAVPKGRVDDLLILFTKGQPMVSGNVILNGKFVWPPGPRNFLEKIRLDLAFGMSGSRFTNPGTQASIDSVSESAQGESKKQQDGDLRTVLSEIRGNIHLRDGTASIANASFHVPGAHSRVHGTYNVLNGRVDLHGVLDTRGRLSDTTSGFKALVLKAATPLFKKENAMRIVPFQITGTYGDTSVTIDWKKDLGSRSRY